MKCEHCNGRGRLPVEPGSSLSYTCPDCGGSCQAEDEAYEIAKDAYWEDRIKERINND